MSNAYEQAKQLLAIHRCSAVITQMDDTEAIGKKVVEVLEELFDYERNAIVLADESGRTLQLLAHSRHGMSEQEAEAEFARVSDLLSSNKFGVIRRVIESGNIVNLANVSSELGYLPGASTIESELCVPLKIFGMTTGAINVESSKPNAFGPDDIELLVTLANQVALAIEHAKLNESSNEIHAERALALRDAAESKHALDTSETLRRLAMDIAELGHAVWDKSSKKCLYCSEFFASVHGLSVDEFIKRFSSEEGELAFVHPQDREKFLSHVDAPKVGKNVHLEYRIVTPEGEVRYVREITTEILSSDGVKVEQLCTIQDITSEKKSEAKLLQAQKMETLGQLTSGVAHDFNNLLTIVLGNGGLIAKQKVEGVDSLIQPVLQAARLGSRLTERLLAYARQQPPNPQRINLNQVLSDIPNLLEPILGETISMQTELQINIWELVADPGQMDTVLLNLAINARDAMPNGGTLTIKGINAHVDIDNFERDPSIEVGDYVVLSVSDTGTGMSKDVLNKAFDPFFTTKDTGRGSGLGLAMGMSH